MPAKKLHHGGNRDWAKAQFSFTGEQWLDLSTGINAAPYPVPPLSDDGFNRLPDPSDSVRLKKAASAYYQAPSPAHLAIAPGSQALIQWLPRLRQKSKVAVIAPTYQEHHHAWSLAGHEVREFESLATARESSPDVIVIVHPNNPTGTLTERKLLLEIAGELAGRGGWLVLDEAFGDVTPDDCLDDAVDHPGLVILRSFGKFFGLAGVRLGICITNTTLASMLETAMGPWIVPGPTLEIATAAYGDTAWIEATRRQIAKDAIRLDNLLTKASCKIVGGTDLFRLAETDDASKLLRHLGDDGIMIRPFEYRLDWLRFGIPSNESDWLRLQKSLLRFYK
ncbi:threonine-phosphate decarboxylase CobD [Aestuariispira insulae]|uniref:threonine-phosphate decarboxylase n=1 Tax=Aestuariispira insulae TaxID=1461337 RepID=A0A3D9HUY9_9PROT|nr:threonine-phosphate decarboxylase CobD [Aestuariispira insulae]RED53308.1 L-threonine O-3-phosphate decarboxylase [Aestuariispira insulae]